MEIGRGSGRSSGAPIPAARSPIPRRILGVDPGSIVTGFGVIDHSGSILTLVEQGAIRTSRTHDLATRLHEIYLGLLEVITRTGPIAVAVESPFAGINARSLIQLAHARGVALLAARTAGVEVFEYSPRSVKSAVVGYGGAEKHQVGKMVRLLVRGVGEARMCADAADALAIAICHAHTHRVLELER